MTEDDLTCLIKKCATANKLLHASFQKQGVAALGHCVALPRQHHLPELLARALPIEWQEPQ